MNNLLMSKSTDAQMNIYGKQGEAAFFFLIHLSAAIRP